MRLEDRIEQIRRDIDSGRFTTSAKESAGVIEIAFREIFRRSIGTVSAAARRKAFEAEEKIGGPNRGIETFTLGELVQLFRESKLFKAYSEATGVELRALTMVNFGEIVAVRNRMQHEMYEASRGEAQLYLHCVENMLEAFGILSLDASASSSAPPAGTDESPDRTTRHKEPSSYTPHEPGEFGRLDEQAELTRAFDLYLFQQALTEAPGSFAALDVGCASGVVTYDRLAPISMHLEQVIGIDSDPKCIGTAKESFPEYSFRVLDVEAVAAEDDLRDLLAQLDPDIPVLASLLVVLHHIASPIRVLRILRNVLPSGSRIVIRTIDEGSILGYPNSERIDQVVALGKEYPEGTDRFHGRKLQYQLRRAGFRRPKVFVQPYTLSGSSATERERLFNVEYAFRSNLLGRAIAAERCSPENLEFLEENIEEIQMDFQDPSFFYLVSWFGAVAEVE